MGTMFVWSTPALNYLDPDYCGQTDSYPCDLELTKQQAVWVNAIAFLGCIFSVPLAGETLPTRGYRVSNLLDISGWIMSKLGIRKTMIGLGLPFGIGIVLITFSKDVSMLLIGRFLYGLSSGAFGLLVPTYTSETAEPRIKGAMGSLLNVTVVLGNLFVAVLGKYFSWRPMTGILLFIPVLMSVWMFFMPESHPGKKIIFTY